MPIHNFINASSAFIKNGQIGSRAQMVELSFFMTDSVLCVLCSLTLMTSPPSTTMHTTAWRSQSTAVPSSTTASYAARARVILSHRCSTSVPLNLQKGHICCVDLLLCLSCNKCNHFEIPINLCPACFSGLSRLCQRSRCLSHH